MDETMRVPDLVLEEPGQATQLEARRGRHRDDDGDTLTVSANLRASSGSGGGRDHDDMLGFTHAETPEALQEEPPEILGVVARTVVEQQARASVRARPQ